MSTAQQSVATGLLISADSHVTEAPDFWEQRLPKALRDKAPTFPARRTGSAHSSNTLDEPRPGGWDPNARVKEMARDGVSAEVVYPTLGLRLYGMEDAALQQACFRAYNDWLIEYCQAAPGRLFGIALISTYDISHAVSELERCRNAGLRGAMVWQVPHPDLPFTSDHYDRFWAAAQDLEMPVSLHILTGFDYSTNLGGLQGLDHYRGAVNLKLAGIMNSVFDLVFTGVLDRFPRLKLVIVESEIGWLPFAFQQWDYYFERFRSATPLTISKRPSEYFRDQMYATFFNDAVGGKLLSWWGEDNCLWSTDYPHPNSSWPHSPELLAETIGHLTPPALEKLVRGNVAQLYGLKLPEPMERIVV